MNAVPLSDTNDSGMPCVANVDRKLLMVASDDVDETIVTSNHLEWASTRTRKVFPKNGPAWSMCSRAQGRAGHSHGWSGAGGGFSD